MDDKCIWERDKDGPGEWWRSACGYQYHGVYHRDTPKGEPFSDRFLHCPYCTKPIIIADRK